MEPQRSCIHLNLRIYIYMLEKLTKQLTIITINDRLVLKEVADMTTAEKLRKARTEMGFSQEYVAKNLNMNRATVAQIELGNRKVTTEEAAQFCRLYHISSDYLLGTENVETRLSMYARGFEELTETDQQEILNLIAFKKAMSSNNGGNR